tara:strand:- start:1433 stop:1546 length:114 start_codon:yes stop_codon:yes gene_type:complete
MDKGELLADKRIDGTVSSTRAMARFDSNTSRDDPHIV